MIRAMLEIRKTDPDVFMTMVLDALKKYPELAVDDEAPNSAKIKALESLLKHFEGIEEYENCSFIVDLKQKIITCQNKPNT